MVLTIVILSVLLMVALAVAVGRTFALRERDQEVHRLKIQVQSQSDENYGLAQENKELHRDVNDHVRNLEMVLKREYLT